MRNLGRVARRVSRRRLASALLAAALFLHPVIAAADPGVLGTWLTEGGKARVRIAECASKLCGIIVWLRAPLDEAGNPKTDKRNDDPALRGRAILGLAMLKDFVKLEPKRWGDGTIYNPEDGETYKCTLTLDEPDTLTVRGYVGIPLFGKTQIWHRVSN